MRAERGGHSFQTLPIWGVVDSITPPIGRVVDFQPIPYHLLVAPLVIINDHPLINEALSPADYELPFSRIM